MTAIVVVVVVALLLVSLTDFSIDLGNIDWSFSGTSIGGVDVNKKLSFSLTDKYAGSALTSKTLVVYDATNMVQLESLTSDATTGIATTAKQYPTGTKLALKYENTNDKVWFSVTVPTMNEKDAEAETYNNIDLDAFSIGTYTSDLLTVGGSSISDAGSYNHTLTGDNPIFSYTLSNSGSDNTGLMDSFDPEYDCAYQVWITVKFSGTNYETIVLTGFDDSFTLGSAQYGSDRMSASKLTKWKVGGDYQSGYTGTDSITFGLDLSGYSGSGVTMQITAYAYADPDYAAANGGNFGVEKVEIAEQTVTLSS